MHASQVQRDQRCSSVARCIRTNWRFLTIFLLYLIAFILITLVHLAPTYQLHFSLIKLVVTLNTTDNTHVGPSSGTVYMGLLASCGENNSSTALTGCTTLSQKNQYYDLSALPVSVGDVLSPPYISMQVMYMGTYICMGITFMQMVIWLLRSRCRQESVLQNPFLKPCVNYIGTVSYILVLEGWVLTAVFFAKAISDFIVVIKREYKSLNANVSMEITGFKTVIVVEVFLCLVHLTMLADLKRWSDGEFVDITALDMESKPYKECKE